MENQFLLDVRTPEEFMQESIPNSINIPMNEISGKLKELAKIKQEILIICRSGARAHAVKNFLEQNNISSKVLEGGLLKNPNLIK